MAGVRREAPEAHQPVEPIPGLDALADAFLSLRTADELRRFLRDLCTFPELEALTHRWQTVLLLDQDVAKKQVFKKGSVLEGTLTYAKEKGDDRGITVTVEWKGNGEQGEVEGRVERTMA